MTSHTIQKRNYLSADNFNYKAFLARLGEPYKVDIFTYANKHGAPFICHLPRPTKRILNSDEFDFSGKIPKLDSPPSLLVVIPTVNTNNYLLFRIPELINQIAIQWTRMHFSPLKLEVILVINGVFRMELVTKLLSYRHFSGVTLTVMHSKIKGKHVAMNFAHQYAIQHRYTFLIFIDDDVFLGHSTIQNIVSRLHIRQHQFIGGYPIPVPPILKSSSVEERALYAMTAVRRSLTGYPRPIGRLLAMRTTSYPNIPDIGTYDDVFLSAFFHFHGVSQTVLSIAPVFYFTSQKYSQWIARNRRIKKSNQQLRSHVSGKLAQKLFIWPKRATTYEEQALTDIGRHMAVFDIAKAHLESNNGVHLDETDLSSKGFSNCYSIDLLSYSFISELNYCLDNGYKPTNMKNKTRSVNYFLDWYLRNALYS